MRVLFMGTPDFAVPALQAIHESIHQLVAVVTIPDRRSGRGLAPHPSAVKSAALDLKYPVLQADSLKSPEFINSVKDCFPDIIVVVAFKILPESIYEIPDYGAVNIHASLLPKYRGAAPIHRAILNGEKETGITTFRITKKVDTGGILLQRRTTIGENETGGELWEKLSKMGADIIIPTLNGLASGSLSPLGQDNSQATKAPKIDKSELMVNWNSSSDEIHNQIRAFSPKPGAYTILNGLRVKLFNSEIIRDGDTILKPAEISPQKNTIFVGTGSGKISIRTLQISGKQKMAVRELLNGFHIENGQKFQMMISRHD